MPRDGGTGSPRACCAPRARARIRAHTGTHAGTHTGARATRAHGHATRAPTGTHARHVRTPRTHAPARERGARNGAPTVHTRPVGTQLQDEFLASDLRKHPLHPLDLPIWCGQLTGRCAMIEPSPNGRPGSGAGSQAGRSREQPLEAVPRGWRRTSPKATGRPREPSPK